MRPSLWHKVLALFRVPAIAWHLGRAGVLGHVGKITLLPNWMQRCCLFLDRLVRSRTATKDAGGALADALLRLGPGFVKFGQALSTRADLIGPEMSLSLSLLQDRLPAFHSSVAHRLVESETGAPLAETFSDFASEPVAAASIAQVHKARLCDGRQVAVKLLRPNIERRMRADTLLFFALSNIMEWVAPGLRRLKLVTAVEQFVEICDIELDLRMEAAAAGRLADNLSEDEGIHVPWVDLERSTSRMLVIEWIEGIRIDDVAALRAAGHDIGQLTEAAANSFFNQVFRDGFFHADMHPGNIFIAPDGRLVPIDFGIMGHLDFADRLFLARLLMAMLDRDYDMVAKLHMNAGMLGEDVSLHRFAQSVRAVADPVMGKTIGDVSLGTVLGQIFQLSTRFEIEVQPQFNLLQKTMMMAEGVARQLNPSADMWSLSRPLAMQWMADQAGLAKRAETFLEDAMLVASRLPRLLKELEDRPHHLPQNSNKNLPTLLSTLALLIAIISFFT